MPRPNILLIVSDQHNPHIAGYAGNSFVRTPNLDALAASGVNFTNAVCNCPVCGPSRASYMTGKYVHQIETWWNRVPLDPSETTWARRLDGAGIPSTLLGKIDVARPHENPGFTNCKLSMHRDGYDPYPLDEPKPTMTLGETRAVSRAHLERAGSFNPETTRSTEHGYSPSHGLYFQDRQVLDWTRAFLRERGREVGGEPWALHVGFEYPHWPYVAPDEYFSMYYPDSVELPHDAVFPRNAGLPAALQEWQRWNDFGEVPEEMLRRVLAAYYGMVTCMDEMIGEIVAELESNGLADNTIILYTSDHGESLGEHGLFYKHSSARAAVGVPLLVAGPGIERGRVVRTPVSLVDLYPTVLDVYGLEVEADRPGESLIRLSKTGTDGAHAREAHAREARARDGVFAEWHGPGFRGAWYMLERLPYKYTWYESFPPTLYNVEADPKEDVNLADDPSYAGILSDFERALYEMLDVDTVSRKAKQDLGLITSDGIDLSKERPPT